MNITTVRIITIIIVILQFLIFPLIVLFFTDIFEFYNLAQMLGIFIIVFQFYLRTFHFPAKMNKYLREGSNIPDARSELEEYKKPFNYLILSLLIFSVALGIVGIWMDYIR